MNEHFSYLLQRFLQKQISEAELHDLSALLLENEDNGEFMASVEAQIRQTGPPRGLDAAYYGNMYKTAPDNLTDDQTINGIIEAILSSDKPDRSTTPTADRKPAAGSSVPPSEASERFPATTHRVHFLRTAWFRYAAALLLIAGTAAFLYRINQPQKEIPGKEEDNAKKKTDIQPGGNKAILTLADGSTITLDSAAIGKLTVQGNTQILKLNNGSLAYQSGPSTGKAVYNTVSTPKGGQYQITLPDGSRVWLNAVSSVTFPTAFVNSRQISITGEAYLEVMQNRDAPFFVSINGNPAIEVLGTSFNINAYKDEQVQRTTLVEGSIRVKRNDQTVLLKPGQQTVVSENGKLTVSAARIASVLAWKNGLFDFEDKKLPEVMRQLSRWYNIEVIYQNGVPDIEFGGKMNRNVTLSDLLEGLKGAGVRFNLEKGRKLVVLSE